MGRPNSNRRRKGFCLLTLFLLIGALLSISSCGSTPPREAVSSPVKEKISLSASEERPLPPHDEAAHIVDRVVAPPEMSEPNEEEALWKEWERSVPQEMTRQEAAIRDGEDTALLDHYEELIGKEGSSPLEWYFYGRFLGKLKNLDGARKAFEKGLGLNPRFFLAREGLALYYLNQENPDAAERELKKCLLINPDFARGHYSLGGLYFQQQKYEKSLGEFKKIPAQRERDFDALFHIGRCHQKLFQWEEAIKAFSKASRLYPDRQEIRYFLAHAYLGKGSRAEAISTYLEAIHADPLDVYSHYQVGSLYLLEGDKEKALSHLTKASNTLPPSGMAGIHMEDLNEKIRQAKGENSSEGQRVSVEKIVEEVSSNPDPAVRRRSLLLLCQLQTHPKLLSVFAKALLDENPTIRAIAIRELGKRSGEEDAGTDVFALVEKIMEDESPHVRGAACAALADLMDERAVPLLLHALQEEDSYVFSESHRALSRLSKKVLLIGFPEDASMEKRKELRKRWERWWEGEQEKKGRK